MIFPSAKRLNSISLFQPVSKIVCICNFCWSYFAVRSPVSICRFRHVQICNFSCVRIKSRCSHPSQRSRIDCPFCNSTVHDCPVIWIQDISVIYLNIFACRIFCRLYSYYQISLTCQCSQIINRLSIIFAGSIYIKPYA